MSLSEKVQQLNRDIGSTVERAIANLRQDLRQEVSQWLRASSEELLGRLAEMRPEIPGSFVAAEDLEPAVRRQAEELSAQARRGGLSELREALGAIDRARSQAEILNALLRESGRYASRAAILLLRAGEVRGWSGQGFGDADARLREVSLGMPQEGAWSHAFQGQGPTWLSAGECALLSGALDSPAPGEGVLVPLVLRDRVAAALYADRTDGSPASPIAADALQVLCYAAALAIESLPFRERASTATLETVAGEPEPAGSAFSGAIAEARSGEAAVPPAPSTNTTTAEEPGAPAWVAPAEATAAEGTYVPDASDVEPVAEIEVEAEPEAVAEPAYREEPAPWASVEESQPYAVRAVEDTIGDDIAAEPASGWGASAAVEETPTPTQQVDLRSFHPEAPAPAAPTLQESPQATVLLQRSTLRDAMAPAPEPVEERPAPAPTPLRPVAAPPPPAPVSAPPPGDEAAATGTPEVRPPSDVQGPGWAFASTRQPVSANEEALHEEARRLARLLVSEIKLYNEEQVEEGRRRRDVYERLKEDIDRSRQMYEERVEPRILKTTDYFYQELVRILAAGDSKALGI